MGRDVKRKSFVFNIEWQEVLMDYPPEVRLEVYDAIIGYVASGTLSELKPLSKMAFSFIKKQIDYNNDKYDNTVTKRSEAGKKGMASRYNKTVTNLTSDNKTNKSYQEVTNVTVYDNDIVNDIVIKESTIVDKKDGKSTRFSPPTVDDIKSYCLERGNNVDSERFFNFYQSKGWMVGKNKMKDWKAAIRTWERKDKQEGGTSEIREEYIIPD